MDTALIHRVRLLRFPKAEAGERNDQGEYARPAEPDPGPWVEARVMVPRGSQAKRRRGQDSTAAAVTAAYEVLIAPTVRVDAVEQPVVITASSILETDCPVLGSPTIEMVGRPELLNDGEDPIGWFGQANEHRDAA